MPKEMLKREFGDLSCTLRQGIWDLTRTVNEDVRTFLRPVRVIIECERVPHEESVHPHSDPTGHIDHLDDFPTTGC